jgi:hypothetical protein
MQCFLGSFLKIASTFQNNPQEYSQLSNSFIGTTFAQLVVAEKHLLGRLIKNVQMQGIRNSEE